MQVVIAPNEDGFGTSAWVVRLVKELVRQRPDARVTVVVATEQRQAFHAGKYAGHGQVNIVRLADAANQIEVVKTNGAVDVPATLERCIRTYTASRATYAASLAQHQVIVIADLIVDFGVPHLVRAAYRDNLQRRLFGGGKQSVVVTVFDHAWSMSLAQMASSHTTDPVLAGPLMDQLERMRDDEALAGEVILFGEPICPLDFHGYWRRTLGRLPVVIPGSLGGPLATLAYVHDPIVEELRAKLLSHHTPLPGLKNAADRARNHARMLLGIHNDVPTLFISGGGTPVWDAILTDLLESYEQYPPGYNVVIYSPAEARRRNAVPVETRVQFPSVERTIARAHRGSLTFIGQVEEETHHVLFPAFDVVLTRAGGGTVNDAIACRVPLVLVEEPGMWQVEQIRQACMELQIAESVTLEAFKQGGRRCVETHDGQLKRLTDQRERMQRIPNHAEIWLCGALLALVE